MAGLYSAQPVARRAHIALPPVRCKEADKLPDSAECPVSSNIAQNYPYSSESEAERSATIARALAGDAEMADKVKAESIGLAVESRWWVWKCPNRGCPGLLHTAGQARNAHAVYTLCDSCRKTYLR